MFFNPLKCKLMLEMICTFALSERLLLAESPFGGATLWPDKCLIKKKDIRHLVYNYKYKPDKYNRDVWRCIYILNHIESLTLSL